MYFILRDFRSFGLHCREEEGGWCYLGHYISTYYTFVSDLIFFLAMSSRTEKKQFDLYFGEGQWWGW